ncbi:MAG TPA: hypothetical protein VLA54_00355 [Acidimicrobiia bacterium]|nr:hypothetical protein [Acidimicrobiia bacterium]
MKNAAGQVLGVRTEFDSVLSVIAPLGLVAAAPRPALMVDLDAAGPAYPSGRSLAELVGEGPTRAELFGGASRAGIALLRNGGVGWESALPVLEALAMRWPALVLRVPEAMSTGLPFPVVPVVPLFPGLLASWGDRAAVWQSTGSGLTAPGPGPVLPALSRHSLLTLLAFRAEPRGRWVRAWGRIWDLPWP